MLRQVTNDSVKTVVVELALVQKEEYKETGESLLVQHLLAVLVC